jgi:hypothetical protein
MLGADAVKFPCNSVSFRDLYKTQLILKLFGTGPVTRARGCPGQRLPGPVTRASYPGQRLPGPVITWASYPGQLPGPATRASYPGQLPGSVITWASYYLSYLSGPVIRARKLTIFSFLAIVIEL